jgi:hypothetical protein
MQAFILKDGLPGSKFRKGLQGRRELIKVLTEKMEPMLRNRVAATQQNSIIAKLLVALEEEGLDAETLGGKCDVTKNGSGCFALFGFLSRFDV